MKRAILLIGLILIIFCGSGNSAISTFYSNNTLHAELSGGDALDSTTGLLQLVIPRANELTAIYGTGLAVVDVKDITMSSIAYLILNDDSGRRYPTILEMTESLHLPSESNVVMKNGGDVSVESDNPGSPSVEWRRSLEFPDDLNLTGLDLNSTLGQISEQDLWDLNMYCEDNGIGYTTGCSAHFYDSSEDTGITCRWGEGETIAFGSSNE